MRIAHTVQVLWGFKMFCKRNVFVFKSLIMPLSTEEEKEKRKEKRKRVIEWIFTISGHSKQSCNEIMAHALVVTLNGSYYYCSKPERFSMLVARNPHSFSLSLCSTNSSFNCFSCSKNEKASKAIVERVNIWDEVTKYGKLQLKLFIVDWIYLLHPYDMGRS